MLTLPDTTAGKLAIGLYDRTEVRKSDRTGNSYEVIVLKRPDGSDFPIFFNSHDRDTGEETPLVAALANVRRGQPVALRLGLTTNSAVGLADLAVTPAKPPT